MIDLVDPALKSSVQSRRVVRKYSFKHFAITVFVMVVVLLLAWLVYLTMNATLDTKPENTIRVNDRIENVEFDGNLPPIQTTPTNQY